MIPDKYTIVVLEEAKRDLLQIGDYISAELNSPLTANRMIKDIRAAIIKIGEFPFTGQMIDVNYNHQYEYRRYIVKSYSIYYFVENSTVYIVKIMHQRRNYNNLK